MKTMVKRMSVCAMIIVLFTLCIGAFTAFADTDDTAAAAQTSTVETAETTEDSSTGFKAVAAGIAIGLASLGGAIGMGMGIAKSSEGIARQPEAEGKIRTNLMLGLVFIETAIIYALIISILVIFVL